jgi:hypothetical protein
MAFGGGIAAVGFLVWVLWGSCINPLIITPPTCADRAAEQKREQLDACRRRGGTDDEVWRCTMYAQTSVNSCK